MERQRTYTSTETKTTLVLKHFGLVKNYLLPLCDNIIIRYHHIAREAVVQTNVFLWRVFLCVIVSVFGVKSSALKTGNYGDINLDRRANEGGKVSVCHATTQTHVRVIVIDWP